MDLVDRFRGAFIGLAAGDALGHPTEFMSMQRIRERFGPRGIEAFAASGRHPAGTFTDDTQMSIAVARALVRNGHADLDATMQVMGEEFVAWANHASNDRAPGGTCLEGCRALARGVAWRQAGVAGSKGCGAAMRAAPVGLWAYDDDDRLVRLAAAQSVLTHAHPTAVASSIAAAAPIAWLCRGHGVAGLLDFTRAKVSALDVPLMLALGVGRQAAEGVGVREMLAALDRVEGALAEGVDDVEDVCALLGGAWIGEEAVACALWCFLVAERDASASPSDRIAETLRRGANSSGDSDSIACIGGGFAGALHGVAAIPERYRQGLERAADLERLAVALHASRSQDACPLPASTDFFDATPADPADRARP